MNFKKNMNLRVITGFIFIIIFIIFILVFYSYSSDEIKTDIPDEIYFTKKAFLIMKINLKIPFAAQALFGEWNDPRQQDGCEEASSLMIYKWLNDDTFISKEEARNKILDISKYQIEKYGTYIDTSAYDTAKRILSGYFGYHDWKIKEVRSIEQIIELLALNKALVIPVNGKKLKNPFFTSGGPDRHMVVVKGYDPDTKEFITNDPGTRSGENYRYNQNLFYDAIRDYPTGEHIPIRNEKKLIIIITKKHKISYLKYSNLDSFIFF